MTGPLKRALWFQAVVLGTLTSRILNMTVQDFIHVLTTYLDGTLLSNDGNGTFEIAIKAGRTEIQTSRSSILEIELDHSAILKIIQVGMIEVHHP